MCRIVFCLSGRKAKRYHPNSIQAARSRVCAYNKAAIENIIYPPDIVGIVLSPLLPVREKTQKQKSGKSC